MERIEPTVNIPKRKISLVGVRANLPKILGAFAIVAAILTVIWITIEFLKPKDKPFIMKGQEVQLSKDVVAVVNGYERRETENEKLKFYIKADKATTFSDNHQELENAYFEAYDKDGEKFDKINSNRAIYVPHTDNSKLFTAQFIGNVNVETRDELKVKSEFITYDHETEIAQTEEPIEFERENIQGKSVGAIVNVRDKKLELLKDVDLVVNESKDLKDVKNAHITAGKATAEQNIETVLFEGNVNADITPKDKAPANVKAQKILAHFKEKKVDRLELTENVVITQNPSKLQANYATAYFENELKRVDLKENVVIENSENGKNTVTHSNTGVAYFENGFQHADLTENVQIDSTNVNGSPTKIRSQVASYDKPSDKFDLKNGVEIITSQDNQPTVIHSNEAIYEQTSGRVFLTGGAEITQGNDLVKGDNITAQLFPNKKLQNSYARGNAYLRQIKPERTTEISGNELNATFNANQQLQNANVVGANSNVVVLPSQPQEYSRATISAGSAIRVLFADGGIINQMQTEGRTTVKMDAPNNNPNSANKRLTADNVKTNFNSSGKDLSRVEAVGNAELIVEPLNAAPSNYKTTINAPRFDCDFYPTGNNAKNCTAQTKAKVVRVPTVAKAGRGVQTLTADKLDASFNQQTQDVQQFDAIGNTKFNELDRNGIANQMNYTANDEVVRLRGGEPTIFDSRARAKAGEIDWDTKNQKSFLRGNVATTYYNQKATNGATPFTRANNPVYITSEQAQFDHQKEIGVYTGNARAWQENNYVRADELVLNQKESRLDGAGKVQSLLYNAQRKEGGKTTTQPVLATSEKIAYTDKDKHLQYQNNVDIRQANDRITGGIADIYLSENNEVKQTIVQNDVVITQPKRKVRGTWAQYTTADETVILKGNPAIAEDAEQGTTQGSQITVSMKENTVVNQGTSKSGGTGRTRTVYKVKNQ